MKRKAKRTRGKFTAPFPVNNFLSSKMNFCVFSPPSKTKGLRSPISFYFSRVFFGTSSSGCNPFFAIKQTTVRDSRIAFSLHACRAAKSIDHFSQKTCWIQKQFSPLIHQSRFLPHVHSYGTLVVSPSPPIKHSEFVPSSTTCGWHMNSILHFAFACRGLSILGGGGGMWFPTSDVHFGDWLEDILLI